MRRAYTYGHPPSLRPASLVHLGRNLLAEETFPKNAEPRVAHVLDILFHLFLHRILFHRAKLRLPRCPDAVGYRLGIRYSHLPHLVWLSADLPPHAPCHAPPVVERQDYVSGLCSLAHRTGALRLDAELHRGPFRLRIKPESPHKDIVLPNDV